MALRTTSMSSGATADNPFGGGGGGSQSTALTLGNNGNQNMGQVVTLPNGTQIRVASQADAQLLNSWWQGQQQAQPGAMSLGGGGGGGGGLSRPLEMAADGAQALSGFFAGRDFTAKLRDYDDAQAELDILREEVSRMSPSGQISPAQFARFIEAQQNVNDTQAAVLETQISAVDIQAGAGVARVVGRFMDGGNQNAGGGGGGTGTALAIGAAGLGAGLLLTRDSRDRRRRR